MKYVLSLGGVLWSHALDEDGESFVPDPARWLLFESISEAILYSFGLPFPVEVKPVGAAVAGSVHSENYNYAN
jgi:hypothetical protein